MNSISVQHDPDALLTELAVAEILNLSIRTLQSWRLRSAGPPFVQVGRAVRYRRRDLIGWIEANTCGGSVERQSCR
ncbi:phage terminase Nu1 subunit (DNA packaging protein) [Bradyrhizobium sp. USDA 4503]